MSEKEKINRKSCFRHRDAWYACMERETASLREWDLASYQLKVAHRSAHEKQVLDEALTSCEQLQMKMLGPCFEVTH